MTIKFTDDHEWVRQENGLVVIGITDFAQQQLGEVVYVEVPDMDRELKQGEEAAVIESVKAAGELNSPVGGVVVEVNETLTEAPEKINDDPDGEGWVYKMKPSDLSELDGLMGLTAYQSLVESLGQAPARPEPG